jgi:hypothetical protein
LGNDTGVDQHRRRIPDFAGIVGRITGVYDLGNFNNEQGIILPLFTPPQADGV